MQRTCDRRLRRADAHEHVTTPWADIGERPVTNPVQIAQSHASGRQGFAGTDNDPRMRGVEPHDIERHGNSSIIEADAEAAALADRVIDDAGMAAEHAPIQMHDIAGLRRIRAHLLNEVAVFARMDEANVLAVGLVGDKQTVAARDCAHLRLVEAAKRKPQAL